MKKILKSRLHIDKKFYNAARYKVHKLIFNKKIIILKINKCIVNRKSYGMSLGLPNKICSCEVSTRKINKTVQHDTNLVSGGFKNYYSTLAGNLLKKLFKPLNVFTLNTVFQYDKAIILLILLLSPKTPS